jgi:hypothetical protein
MLEDHEMIAIWQEMGDAFRAGDKAAFASVFADDFNGMLNDISLPSRQAFVDACWAGRERGWIDQRFTTISASHNVLTLHYVNHYSDGSTTNGGGAVLFNDDGKIAATRALTLQVRAIQPPS